MDIVYEKIASYLGFAIKSDKIKIGLDEILKCKTSKIIICTNTLSENASIKLKTFAEKQKIKILFVPDELIVSRFGQKNIKAVAILDKNLADAINNKAI